jgi:hypothetical protein
MKDFRYIVTMSLLMIHVIGINGQTAEFYQKKIDHFKTQRIVGTVFIVSFVPTTAVGIYYFVKADRAYASDDPWGGFWTGSDYFIPGCLFVGAGAGLLAGGIVMTTIGNKKIRFYQEKLDGLSIHPYITPRQAGLTLTYRF